MEEVIVSAVVSEATSQVADSLIGSVKREISYVFKYKSYIGDVEDKVKEMEYLRQRVEQAVEHADRQGEEIFEDVKAWLIRVEHFTGSIAKPIIDDGDRAKNRCFKGLCPNLLKRYSLSKKAVEAAEEGDYLLRKGNFNPVSFRPAPERPVLKLGRGYQEFDSRMSIFQDIMDVLTDSNVDTIGIYGMGGVGKTTLVKQVARQVMENKLFDEVVIAEVTQNPDLKTIQDKISRDLSLQFDQRESVFERADRLRERLKKVKRVLVILDNIWRKLELDDIGIPYGDDPRRCTIILTSRSRDLLCNDMNSHPNFFIEVLSKEEAGQLFEKIVGESAKVSDFQRIADEIVGRCGGLSVALNTIANALKNKSLLIWKDALDKLRNSNPREIHGMDANVYSSIAMSYNFLESDEAKSLFLLCGLHKAGDSVSVPYLMRYGMGLGLFKGVHKLETAKNRVHTLVDNLKSSCLLLDDDNENWVKMHDIIHEVAVSIATEKLMFSIPNVADTKEEIEKTMQKGPTAISILCEDVYELPERLECEKLVLFFLVTKYNSSLQIPDLFFEGMKELKVIDFTGICFPSLPSSLGCLLNLQTLCLDDCRLEDITIVGQLKKLEILSFNYSDIMILSFAIGELTSLRLLDLSNCRKLEVIAPNFISKLSRLEELYMINSFTRWKEVERGSNNASLVELKGLLKLTTLDIHVEDTHIMPYDLVTVKLERYRIFIGNVWDKSFNYKISRLMKLINLEKYTLLGHEMKILLKTTEELHIEKLKGFQNIVHELNDGVCFPRLKHFHVENCYDILHIFSLVGRVHCKVFPLLESLVIHNLINLEKICHGQFTEDQSLRKLRIIRVEDCNRMKHLFSFSMAKNLLRLQKVIVSGCENLEMIVGHDMERPITSGFKEIIAGDDPDERVNFPSLEELKFDLIAIEKLWPDRFQEMYCCQNLTKISVCNSMEGVVVDTTGLGREEGKLMEMIFPKLLCLKLSSLPELTSFAKVTGIHSVEFPSLLQLKIKNCYNLRRFFTMSSSVDNIHTRTQPQPLFDDKVGLPNLDVLRIKDMENLRKIWHNQLASDSFRKLKELNIEDCHKLMNIFPPVAGLPSLEVLKIAVMSLRKIWNHQHDADSSSKLKQLKINQCHKLKNIFPSNIIMGRRLERLEYLKVKDCNSISEIIGETSSNSMDSTVEIPTFVFPHLTSLNLMDLPKLKSFVSEFISEESQQPLMLLNHKVAMPSLMTLNVSSCDELRSLMTLSVAENMMELTKMEIKYCIKIEEIIHQVGEVKKNNLVFSQLESLEFCYLPNLQCFCLGNYNLEFPSLQRVVVQNCYNMKTFSHGVSGTPKLKKVHVHPYDKDGGEWEGNLNSTIQKLFKEMLGLCDIWHLKFSQIPHLKEKWHSQSLPVSFFSKLRSLVVDDCTNMSSAIPEKLLLSLNKLSYLKVRNCDSVEEVFYLEDLNADEQFGPLFPKLDMLELIDLPEIKRFCKFTRNIITLPNLCYLTIENCPNMETFISNSTSLHLTTNKETEEPNTAENFLLADMQPLFDEKVSLSRLRELKLSRLPKMLHLLKENSQPSEVFQCLEILEISECNKLENLVPFLVSFKYLTTLKISKCDGLLNLMTISTAKSLMKLDMMTITDCKRIEEIIVHDGEEVKDDCIVFSGLVYLRLDCLPSLTGFCLRNYTLKFPSLEVVVVRECPKMKTFSAGVLCTPWLHKVQVKEEEEEIEGNENDDDGGDGDEEEEDDDDDEVNDYEEQENEEEEEDDDDDDEKEEDDEEEDDEEEEGNNYDEQEDEEEDDGDGDSDSDEEEEEEEEEEEDDDDDYEEQEDEEEGGGDKKDEGNDDEGHWKGNLNSTIQQLFKEMNARISTDE